MIKRKIGSLKRKRIQVVKKRRKSTPLRKLKKKLWDLCRHIQIKKYGNTCYTCGRKNLSGSNLQLGHGITSSLCSTAIRYDLRHLRPQDYHCNINLSGNWPAFRKNLIAEGIDVDALLEENETTKGKVYPISWFEERIAEYTLLSTPDA